MQWYNGEIREAVTFAQTKKAVFFVAILGTDESSEELEKSLNTPELQAIVSTEDFVSIRLEADSEQHKLFAQIYANAKSPSIYCITDKGIPVEIITTALPTSELKERLESALVRHRQVLGAKPPVVSASASASVVETKNESKPDSSLASSSSSSAPSNDPPSTADDDSSLEARIQRARELAAARQLKKQQDEEEEQRRREIERRKELKGAAELKRWQEEQQAKKEMDERKKDREDEKLLRQRLREQIAQDRAARNARTNVEVIEQTTTPVQRPTVTSAPPANYSGQARLQFRLPDGSSQTHAFEPDSTLGHVRQYLTDQGSVPFREFSLWVAFPRRQFADTDYGTSLRELGLLPSAALLVLPSSGLSMNPSSNGGLWALIATLLGFVVYPITLVWSVFQRALPAPPASNSSTNKSQNGSDAADKRLNSMGQALGSRGDQPSTSSGANPSTNSATNSNDNLAANKRKTKDKNNSSATQKESGNVHRLRTMEDDSEDDAFYNGNSTQQM